MEFKDNEQVKTIFSKLKRKLNSRGFSYVSDDDIFDEIESAISAVNSRRRFSPTANLLFENQYESLIIRLCISSISKWGAEGEVSHSENNIIRNYETASEYPTSLLSEIVPLGKARKQ